MASRILGMGDIVGLMTDFEKIVDEKQAEADAKRMLAGKFTLGDFLEQIRILKRMGSLRDVMEKLPFFSDAMADGAQFDDKALQRIESMIQSMTPDERKKPDIINARRLQRIARGSGRKPQEVQDLLQRYQVMRQLMGRIGQQPGLLSRLPGFGQMGQMARMKGMNVDDFFDGLEGMGPGGMGGMPGGMGGMAGMPGPGGMAGMGGGINPALAAAAGMGGPKLPPSARQNFDRDKRNKKNKMAAQARKKNRKK
jgi:signal recognition particle subunit SRP54